MSLHRDVSALLASCQVRRGRDGTLGSLVELVITHSVSTVPWDHSSTVAEFWLAILVTLHVVMQTAASGNVLIACLAGREVKSFCRRIIQPFLPQPLAIGLNGRVICLAPRDWPARAQSRAMMCSPFPSPRPTVAHTGTHLSPTSVLQSTRALPQPARTQLSFTLPVALCRSDDSVRGEEKNSMCQLRYRRIYGTPGLI